MNNYITNENVNQAGHENVASGGADATMFPELNSILHTQIEPKREQAAIVAALFREIAGDMLVGDIEPYADIMAADIRRRYDKEVRKWKKKAKNAAETKRVYYEDPVTVLTDDVTGQSFIWDRERDMIPAAVRRRGTNSAVVRFRRNVKRLEDTIEEYQRVAAEGADPDGINLEAMRQHFAEFYVKRSEKMEACGSFLEFGYHIKEDVFRLQKANFCKARLCPMCSHRRSLKLFSQLSKVVDAVSDAGYQYVFMTLTMKNVEASELPDAISQMLQSFSRMMDRKSLPGRSGVRGEPNPVSRMCRGYFRSLEVTASAERGYHPHLHVLVAVDPDYFTGLEYLDQRTLGETWRRFLGVEYSPVVDIRKPKVYGQAERNSAGVIRKAVLEICKYTVKSSDIVGRGNESREEVKRRLFALDTALRDRNIIGMSGVFKKFHKELNLSDVDDINADDIENPTVADLIIRLHWCGYGWHAEYEEPADKKRITE